MNVFTSVYIRTALPPAGVIHMYVHVHQGYCCSHVCMNIGGAESSTLIKEFTNTHSYATIYLCMHIDSYVISFPPVRRIAFTQFFFFFFFFRLRPSSAPYAPCSVMFWMGVGAGSKKGRDRDGFSRDGPYVILLI